MQIGDIYIRLLIDSCLNSLIKLINNLLLLDLDEIQIQ